MSNKSVTPALRRNAGRKVSVADTFAASTAQKSSPTTMKKTSLQLDAELYRRIKVLAATEGTNPGELVNAALREFLDRQA